MPENQGLSGSVEEQSEDRTVFNRTWFKAYSTDFFSDRRIALLTDVEYRTWMGLLALANDNLEPGYIRLSDEQVALMLRQPKKHVMACIEKFIATHMIKRDELGYEIVDRSRFYRGAGLTQSDSPEGNAERQRKHRAKKKASEAAESNGYCNGDPLPENEEREAEALECSVQVDMAQDDRPVLNF